MFKLSPLTPLEKGLNLGERSNPLFHVCESVDSEGRDQKQLAAGKQQNVYKKVKIYTANINLPLGQAWLLLSILLDITARTTSQKNFANLNDRNHTSFLPSHELEVTFAQTS